MGASMPTDSGSSSYLPCSNHRFLKASVGPTEDNGNSDFNDNALAQAEENDESLHQVRKWTRNKRAAKIDELQGLPRLGWQIFNQVSSLHIKNNVLCRKFKPLDGKLPFLQWIVPRSMVPEILTALHSSEAAGHLGMHKVIEKQRQRFYWPGFKEDVKQFIQCCDVCRNKSGPQKPTALPYLTGRSALSPSHWSRLSWSTSHF